MALCSWLCVTTGGAAAAEGGRHEWQSVNADMSPGEYRASYRHNQRIIRDFVESHSKNALTSIGVPKSGVKLMGAAAGLAAGQDAKFYLNKSKLMALEVKDATDDDRALFFGIKLDW